MSTNHTRNSPRIAGYAVIVLCLFAVTQTPARTAVITYDSLTGAVDTVQTWAPDGTERYAQQTVVPVGASRLQDMRVRMDGFNDLPITLRVRVLLWDGSSPIGGDLFNSGNLAVGGVGFFDVFVNIDLLLVSGQEVVAIVESVSGDSARFRQPDADLIPGTFVFQNGNQPWVADFLGQGADLGVVINWTDQSTGGDNGNGNGTPEIPEPRTFVTMAVGIVTLVLIGLYRRN